MRAAEEDSSAPSAGKITCYGADRRTVLDQLRVPPSRSSGLLPGVELDKVTADRRGNAVAEFPRKAISSQRQDQMTRGQLNTTHAVRGSTVAAVGLNANRPDAETRETTGQCVTESRGPAGPADAESSGESQVWKVPPLSHPTAHYRSDHGPFAIQLCPQRCREVQQRMPSALGVKSGRAEVRGEARKRTRKRSVNGA
jgi:hypothetical protein